MENEILITGFQSYRLVNTIAQLLKKNGYVIESTFRNIAAGPPIGFLMKKEGQVLWLRSR